LIQVGESKPRGQGETPAVRPVPSHSWEGLIETIKKTRPLLASILEHAIHNELPHTQRQSSISSTGETHQRVLSIYFSPQDAYFREQLQSRISQEQLHQISQDYFGFPVQLRIELKNDERESLAAKRQREEKERIQGVQLKAKNHPIILEAKSLFGGEMSPVEIKEVHGHAHGQS
jgi:DNA polymerase III subunit gamma/tau